MRVGMNGFIAKEGAMERRVRREVPCTSAMAKPASQRLTEVCTAAVSSARPERLVT